MKHSSLAIRLLLSIMTLSAFEAVAEDSLDVDFNRDVVPIFNKYCAGCHNADDKEGELSLESFRDLQAGGSRGPAIIPGQAASSRLIRVLTGLAEPAMPPEDNEAPKPAEIEWLRAWIDAGAKGPDGAEPDRKILLTPQVKPKVGLPRPIVAIDYSPDGTQLAVARFQDVELIDAVTWNVLRKLSGHPGKVNGVCFTSDGKSIVTASGLAGLYGEARMWNVVDGRLLRTFSGHADTLYAAVPSPDGALVATAGYDHEIILWNAETGAQLRTLAGHNDAIYDLAFSPDGRVLASASGDQTVKLWNVASGLRLDTLGQPLKEQYAVAFSPDGSHVVAGGVDNRIRVWRLLSSEEPRINPIEYARFAHEAPIVRLAFSRDGKTLVSVGEDRMIKLWETRTFTQTYVYELQPDVTPALAVAPDGGQLAVGRMDGSLRTYPIDAETSYSSVSPERNVAATLASAPQSATAELRASTEVEPNDTINTATPITVPASINGIVYGGENGQTADVDGFRFTSEAEAVWMIEINAASSDSPLDPYVEVLDGKGQPILRTLLQAVRDSYVTFRGGDSRQAGVRLHNWEEMQLNEYLYRKGEVCKLFRMPQGPDSDMLMYTENGARRCYFDTTATAYALNEPCYIVRPYAPGSQPIPNGLPVFPLYYENDDDATRKSGRDSRLTFTAPEDGEYLVRVRDVRGQQGEDFQYTLVVRRPRPDFEIKLEGTSPSVNVGSGKEFRVIVDRIDGFDGEVRVDIEGAPPGFSITSPVVVEAGHDEAVGMVFASADAPAPGADNSRTSTATATAVIQGNQVTKPIGGLGEIKLAEPPKLRVRVTATNQPASRDDEMEPVELVISPGETISAELHLERLDFDQRVSFEPRNLPHGVILDNIGLNGVLIPAGQTDRTIFLSAAKWVAPMTRTFFLKSAEEGGQTSRPIVLHVRPPDS